MYNQWMSDSIDNKKQGRESSHLFHTILIVIGNTLTLIGGVFLLLGLTNVVHFDVFSFGLSSGIRIVGMVIISGCLLSAVGYGLSDFIKD